MAQNEETPETSGHRLGPAPRLYAQVRDIIAARIEFKCDRLAFTSAQSDLGKRLEFLFRPFDGRSDGCDIELNDRRPGTDCDIGHLERNRDTPS